MVNRVRGNRAASLAARSLAKPVADAADQMRQKVWINGATVALADQQIRFPNNVGIGIASNLYWGRGYEPEVTQALRRMLPSCRLFADVGANVGVYSVLSAKFTDVWAFEPVSELVLQNKMMQKANNVTYELFEFALAAQDGTTTIYLPASEGEVAANASINSGTWQAQQTTSSRSTVLTRTFDSVCADKGRWPDLVKIDVEEAELGVLRGMSELMKRRPKIICEILPLARTDHAETQQLLAERGYTIMALTTCGAFQLSGIPRDRTFWNFLLLPEEEAIEYLATN